MISYFEIVIFFFFLLLDITSRAVANEGEDYGWDDELEKTRVSREALSRLSKVVESKVSARYRFCNKNVTLKMHVVCFI